MKQLLTLALVALTAAAAQAVVLTPSTFTSVDKWDTPTVDSITANDYQAMTEISSLVSDTTSYSIGMIFTGADLLATTASAPAIARLVTINNAWSNVGYFDAGAFVTKSTTTTSYDTVSGTQITKRANATLTDTYSTPTSTSTSNTNVYNPFPVSLINEGNNTFIFSVATVNGVTTAKMYLNGILIGTVTDDTYAPAYIYLSTTTEAVYTSEDEATLEMVNALNAAAGVAEVTTLVPEPTCLALLALGVAGLALKRKVA